MGFLVEGTSERPPGGSGTPGDPLLVGEHLDLGDRPRVAEEDTYEGPSAKPLPFPIRVAGRFLAFRRGYYEPSEHKNKAGTSSIVLGNGHRTACYLLDPESLLPMHDRPLLFFSDQGHFFARTPAWEQESESYFVDSVGASLVSGSSVSEEISSTIPTWSSEQALEFQMWHDRGGGCWLVAMPGLLAADPHAPQDPFLVDEQGGLLKSDAKGLVRLSLLHGQPYVQAAGARHEIRAEEDPRLVEVLSRLKKGEETTCPKTIAAHRQRLGTAIEQSLMGIWFDWEKKEFGDDDPVRTKILVPLGLGREQFTKGEFPQVTKVEFGGRGREPAEIVFFNLGSVAAWGLLFGAGDGPRVLIQAGLLENQS